MIEFKNIRKQFGPKIVLDDVSLTVDRSQILFIVGTSGAGKSVLVKHLVGLLKPDGGQIFIDNEEITRLTERQFYRIRKKCTYVFQHSTLFDSMSLLDNVALTLRKHKNLSHQDAREAAMKKLELVQMESFADRYPADIGDGLRKRVAIARALTMEPEFIIFDEPTTGLDPLSAAHVDKLIRSLSDDVGVTSIVVSHDLRSIFTIADRIVMIYKGKIRLNGTPAEYRNSQDPIVQQFIRGLSEGPLEI